VALTPIVNEPTRGHSALDRIYTWREPCYQTVKVIASVVKSDHKAVAAYVGEHKTTVNKKKIKPTFRKRSPPQHSLFLNHLSELEIKLPNTYNSQADFDQLYTANF